MDASRCFHSMSRGAGGVLIGAAVVGLLAIATERLLVGAWPLAVGAGAAAVALLAWRLMRGALPTGALIEVTPHELIWRRTVFAPSRALQLPVHAIAAIEIVGPTGDRRFRLRQKDGARAEIRPFFGRRFEREPPGFLARRRGDV